MLSAIAFSRLRQSLPVSLSLFLFFFFCSSNCPMGQTLSEPITTKETTEGGDARVHYGASCMQGWRISEYSSETRNATPRMPMRYLSPSQTWKTLIPLFPSTRIQVLVFSLYLMVMVVCITNIDITYIYTICLTRILGPNVAKYSGNHLHDLVFESKYYKEGNIKEALRSSFLGIDEKLRQGNNHFF